MRSKAPSTVCLMTSANSFSLGPASPVQGLKLTSTTAFSTSSMLDPTALGPYTAASTQHRSECPHPEAKQSVAHSWIQCLHTVQSSTLLPPRRAVCAVEKATLAAKSANCLTSAAPSPHLLLLERRGLRQRKGGLRASPLIAVQCNLASASSTGPSHCVLPCPLLCYEQCSGTPFVRGLLCNLLRAMQPPGLLPRCHLVAPLARQLHSPSYTLGAQCCLWLTL